MNLKTGCAVLISIIAFSILAEDNPFRMGDHLLKRGDYAEALAEYQKFFNANQNDPQAMWRVGAALTRIALTELGNGRQNKLEEATNLLNRTIVADSKIVGAHLEYARALGYIGLFKPDWDDARLARRVREELLIVLKEEMDNADAYFLMGLWHRWVGPKPLLDRMPNGLGAASLDSAVVCLRKASKLDDTALDFKLELARTYIYTGNPTMAKEILKNLIATKDVPKKYAGIPAAAAEELRALEAPKPDDEK